MFGHFSGSSSSPQDTADIRTRVVRQRFQHFLQEDRDTIHHILFSIFLLHPGHNLIWLRTGYELKARVRNPALGHGLLHDPALPYPQVRCFALRSSCVVAVAPHMHDLRTLQCITRIEITAASHHGPDPGTPSSCLPRT